MKRTILESAQVSHSATSKPEEMYLVTKKELNLIKNDCAYPERQFCDGCECADGEDNTRASGLGCNFEGANAVMDRVLSRPAPSSHEENNVIKNLKAICEAQQEKIVALLEIRALYEEKEKLQEQYDVAIAAKAREDETNRIISILEGYRLGLDYPDCPPGDTIKSLVESLRSSSTTTAKGRDAP